MDISTPAIEIIKEEEVFRGTAYDDARPDYVLKKGDKIQGTLTIGYGHTDAARDDDKKISIGDTITEEEATEILLKDLEGYVDIVNNRMKTFDVELTQAQFDGLVYATLNRPEKMSSGKLWRAIANGDVETIKSEWKKTVEESIKEFPGLLDRTEDELEMFFGTEEDKEELTEDIDMDRGIPNWQEEGFEPGYSIKPKEDNSQLNMIWTKLYNDLANAFIDNPRTYREKELFERNPIYYAKPEAKDKTEKVVYDSKEKQNIHDIYSRMMDALSESLMR